MEFQPVPSVVASSFIKKSPWWFFLLVLTSVIILLIVLMVPFGGLRNGLTVQSNLAYKANFSFNSALAKTNFEDFINRSKADQGEQKAVDLIGAFQILSNDYISQPTTEKYTELKSLFDQINKEFPSQLKQAGLVVPCLQESCGYKPNTAISKIIEEVKASNIDQTAKGKILFDLATVQNAEGQKNTVWEFNSLAGVFFDLKAASQKAIAQEVLDLMNKISPEMYKLQKGLSL